MKGNSKDKKHLLVWLVIAAAAIVLNFVLPSTAVSIYTKALIMILFALSLNMQLGYAGMMPLGHATLLGFGAYSYTLLLRAGLPLPLAVLLAIVISTLLGVLVGYFCLRGNNAMTFTFLSMGIGTLLYTIVLQAPALGRDVGLSGAARPQIAATPIAFGVAVTIIVLLCVYLLYRILHSPFSLIVTGLRENEERLVFLGINTKRLQLVIFTISGTFAAIAGILFAMLNGGAYPSFLSTSMTMQGLMMCLIGGMSTFVGPALGAVIVTLIVTEVSNLTNYWQAVLGIIIVACVLFFRGGILGSRPPKKKAPVKGKEKNHG